MTVKTGSAVLPVMSNRVFERAMKITMLRNPAKGYGCELMEGQTGDVAAELGQKLVDAKIAVVVEVEKKKPAEQK